MEQTTFSALLPEAVEQIGKGAFLTAGGEKVNPMTIGWGQFGVVWGKPMVLVLVRKSRYTFTLLEKTDTFTVSIPASGTMQKELTYCGSHSGRDSDKLAGAQLNRAPARCGGADGIAGCAMRIECRIVQRADLPNDHLDDALRTRYYTPTPALPDGDPHTLFFGEVLGAYRD